MRKHTGSVADRKGADAIWRRRKGSLSGGQAKGGLAALMLSQATYSGKGRFTSDRLSSLLPPFQPHAEPRAKKRTKDDWEHP